MFRKRKFREALVLDKHFGGYGTISVPSKYAKNLTQVEKDGIRYLYEQFKKKTRGVFMHGSNYSRRVQEILFVRCILPSNMREGLSPCLFLSDDDTVYYWEYVCQHWGEAKTESSEESCNDGDSTSFPTPPQSFNVIVIDTLDEKELKKLEECTANFVICNYSEDVETHLEEYKTYYKRFIDPNGTFDPYEHIYIPIGEGLQEPEGFATKFPPKGASKKNLNPNKKPRKDDDDSNAGGSKTTADNAEETISNDNHETTSNQESPSDNHETTSNQESPTDNHETTSNQVPPTNNHETTSNQESLTDNHETTSNQELPTNNHETTSNQEPPSDNHETTSNQESPSDNHVTTSNQEPPADNHRPTGENSNDPLDDIIMDKAPVEDQILRLESDKAMDQRPVIDITKDSKPTLIADNQATKDNDCINKPCSSDPTPNDIINQLKLMTNEVKMDIDEAEIDYKGIKNLNDKIDADEVYNKACANLTKEDIGHKVFEDKITDKVKAGNSQNVTVDESSIFKEIDSTNEQPGTSENKSRWEEILNQYF